MNHCHVGFINLKPDQEAFPLKKCRHIGFRESEFPDDGI
jgi:hypothetical protein